MSSISLSCIVVITEQTFNLKVPKNIKLSELKNQCKSKINEKIPFKICLNEEYLVEEHLNLQDGEVLYIILDELPTKDSGNCSKMIALNNGPTISNQPVPLNNSSTRSNNAQEIPSVYPQQNNNPYLSLMMNCMENPEFMKFSYDLSLKMMNQDPENYARFCQMWMNIFSGGSNNSSTVSTTGSFNNFNNN